MPESHTPSNQIRAVPQFLSPTTGAPTDAYSVPIQTITGTPIQGYAAGIAITPGTTIISPPGTGLANYITDITITNTTTVAVTVTITNGGGGAGITIDTFIVAAGATLLISRRSPYTFTSAAVAYASIANVVDISMVGVQAVSSSVLMLSG